jgi:hypothetical protein
MSRANKIFLQGKTLIKDIERSIDRLRRAGRYTKLIRNLGQSELLNTPFIFEILFADAFESHGLYLTYEFNANPLNDKFIDFLYQVSSDERVLFELVSPEMSDALQNEYSQKIYTEGLTLSSQHPNRFLRPEAQTLRIQEKILEKVEKFPAPDDRQFSVIVVNCSNFHSEHFDDEDSRIIMYGKPRNPIFTERWQGKRIIGLLEQTHKKENSSDFRQKITAVVFIQNKDLLNGAWIICNTNRTEQHRKIFKNILRNLPPFERTNWLEMAT